MALVRRLGPTGRHELDDPARVGWLELFFDLIYVAALIQLGDRLSDDVSWSGFAQFAGAFVVLWWTWTGTTALINRFAVDDVAHRLLTFVQMFAVGNFAIFAAMSDVDDRSTVLVFSYIAARLPLLAMYWRARARIPEARPITNLYTAAFGAGSAMWAASLLFPTDVRWWIWAVALGVEFTAPVIGGLRGVGPPTHDHHFKERYALFTIIVLGETFVKTLSEVTVIGVSAQTQVFGALGFVILVSLWWTYYDDVAESDVARQSALGTSTVANRLVWVYVHLPLAMGLTAFGVAAKKVVAVDDFGDALSANYSWLLACALAAVLVSTAVIDTVTVSPHFGVRTAAQVSLRLVSAALIIGLGALLATGTIDALVGVGLVAVVSASQIAAEVAVAARAEQRLDESLSEHRTGDGCDHLDEALDRSIPAAPVAPSCEACDEIGQAWVQLRQCLSCGHVGCCDDSPGRHANSHHDETQHELVITLEDGDAWAYCFTHDRTDPQWQQRHRERESSIDSSAGVAADGGGGRESNPPDGDRPSRPL